MDDLSKVDNPVVIICLLLAMVVAGLQVSNHRDHFFGAAETIEQRN